MGASRNLRSQKEATFLHMVKEELVSLHREVNDMRSILVNIYSNLSLRADCHMPESELGLALLPPAAPPPLDTYNREYLLQCRAAPGQPVFDLPTTMNCVRGNVEVYCYEQPPEEDEISDFLREQGHFCSDDAPCEDACFPDAQDTTTRDALKEIISVAQVAAYSSRSLNGRAAASIQVAWKKFKRTFAFSKRSTKVEGHIVDLPSEVTPNAFAEECGSAQAADQLVDSNEPSLPLEATPRDVRHFRQECWSFIPEDNHERDKTLLQQQRAETMHCYTMDPDLAALFNSAGAYDGSEPMDRSDTKRVDRLADLDDRHMPWFESVMDTALELPKEKQAIFAFQQVFGFYFWNKNDMEAAQVRIIVQYLEHVYDCLKSKVLPFSCNSCRTPHEHMLFKCPECDGTDIRPIFDIADNDSDLESEGT